MIVRPITTHNALNNKINFKANLSNAKAVSNRYVKYNDEFVSSLKMRNKSGKIAIKRIALTASGITASGMALAVLATKALVLFLT